MAFGRLPRSAAPTPLSDINITPLVDVMLVLVVIFILTAPLLASSIRLDLPRSDGAVSGAATPETVPRMLNSRKRRNLLTSSMVTPFTIHRRFIPA